MIKDQIEEKLLACFSPTFLKVEDVSALHEGHWGYTGGGETHFKVTIVSVIFQEMPRIERHQRVYRCLEEELKGGVHALQVAALCPGEVLPEAE